VNKNKKNQDVPTTRSTLMPDDTSALRKMRAKTPTPKKDITFRSADGSESLALAYENRRKMLEENYKQKVL